jgi:hypothetical protein
MFPTFIGIVRLAEENDDISPAAGDIGRENFLRTKRRRALCMDEKAQSRTSSILRKINAA